MLDKIDPLAAALRNLEQQQDELNAAFASGKINGSQFENYSRKIQETRRELTGEAQAEREAAKAHDEQVVALQRLIAQLDPVGTAFNRLTEQQKQLSEAKAKGMLSPEMYEELSGKLRAMRSELEATQSQLSKTGMSAKQTAFAMRIFLCTNDGYCCWVVHWSVAIYGVNAAGRPAKRYVRWDWPGNQRCRFLCAGIN